MTEEKEVLWCLWIGEEDTDYVLCSWDIDLLPTLYQQDNIRYQYNQQNQKWSQVSCTIFAAMGMVSDLMNYEFSLDELKEVDELSYEKGRVRGKGWYVKSAVDLVRKRWNEKHRDLWMIAYYRVSKYNPDFDWILQKWYTLDGNMCPTGEFKKDVYTDAVLDWKDFWKETNWHSLCAIWDNHRAIKDNYKGRKTYDGTKDSNVYELKHRINEISNFWQWFYIYTKVQEDNLEEIKRLNEIKVKCNLIINHLGDLWHMVNDSNFQWILHYTAERLRKKIEDANKELKKYI